MKRRSLLLSAATLFVPVPARPAPFVQVIRLTAGMNNITFTAPSAGTALNLLAMFLQPGDKTAAKPVTWPPGIEWEA